MIAARRVTAWHADDETNVWELSGMYEGDIMIYHASEMDKNGLVNQAARWPEGIVPYHISESFCECLIFKMVCIQSVMNDPLLLLSQ